MFEHVFASLPEGVATTPPGAALGALLEQVDPRTVSPHDTVVLVRAWRRQLSHHEARFALAAREAALADPDRPGGRREGMGEFSADELRVVLHESRTRVGKLLGQADTAIAAIPPLWAAWDAGRIDTDRVRICVTWTSSLSAEHAARVVREVLPEAPRLTLSGLIDRIQQLASGLDPGWAARLYDNARRQRRVRTRRTEAGTLNLSALDLPLDAGCRSAAHIDAMAVRAKALGHPGLIDTIRTDILLALLSPRGAGHDDDTVIAAVIAAADPADPPGRRSPQHVGRTRPAREPAEDDGEPDGEPARPGGGPRRSRIELRVGLLTLLGLDEKPATMPGYGVVHSVLARQFARQLCSAQWRVAVTDDQGLPVAALLLRRRPRGYATTPPEDPSDTPVIGPRPIVELHIDETALDRLRPAEHPGWTEVIEELQAQYAAWRPPEPESATEAARRLPPEALTRWIQVRDRTCVFPPCRASSVAADIDHTRAATTGGPTAGANLGALCRHDHRLKHEAGWHLDQTAPGTFTWTSPTGHTYRQHPQAAAPDIPPPATFRPRSSTTPTELASDEPLWTNDPYPDTDPASPPGRHGRPDDPPF
ncbi:hypothetical protein ACQPX6_05500 [Actinomycetospora sp. CA-101289]|uniref:hypothetical protein n=1 Tax=Actinomycetospora sp. CA-101289 TaxID=3239893 RepID=UPI003D972521